MRSGSTATKPSDKTPTATKSSDKTPTATKPRNKTPTGAIAAPSTLKHLKADTAKPGAGPSTLKRRTPDASKTTTTPKRAKKAKTEKEVKVEKQDVKGKARALFHTIVQKYADLSKRTPSERLKLSKLCLAWRIWAAI
jgi:hypothetical protein